MEQLHLFEDFLNEQQRYDSYTYPLKNEREAERMLSGRSRGSWLARKYVGDLIDVFGKEASILEGDEVTEYLQIWSDDSSEIFKITRRNRIKTWHVYIPSKYHDKEQYEEIADTL
jgi:hypothetical protein